MNAETKRLSNLVVYTITHLLHDCQQTAVWCLYKRTAPDAVGSRPCEPTTDPNWLLERLAVASSTNPNALNIVNEWQRRMRIADGSVFAVDRPALATLAHTGLLGVVESIKLKESLPQEYVALFTNLAAQWTPALYTEHLERADLPGLLRLVDEVFHTLFSVYQGHLGCSVLNPQSALPLIPSLILVEHVLTYLERQVLRALHPH